MWGSVRRVLGGQGSVSEEGSQPQEDGNAWGQVGYGRAVMHNTNKQTPTGRALHEKGFRFSTGGCCMQLQQQQRNVWVQVHCQPPHLTHT